jgi:hypothetical protein
MLQVIGSVAVSPWSAFVAVVSSWMFTTYVADAKAARVVNGTALKVMLARPTRVLVFDSAGQAAT